MDLSKCALCDQVIIKGARIYRAFDNTYCSKVCSIKTCSSIDRIDPEHKMPAKWKNASCAHIISISEESQKYKDHIQQTSNEISLSKLSLVQYSLIIASTFGIIAYKNCLNSNPNSLQLL